MTFIYGDQRPKVFRAQVDGQDGYALLLDQDDPESVIYFLSWQRGLTRWMTGLSLIVGQSPPDDLPTLEDHLRTR